MGALGEQRRERQLRGDGVAVCGREVGKLCDQGLPVGGGQHAEEPAHGDAGTTGHTHDLEPEPPTLQLLQAGRIHPHPDLQVRRQPRLVRTHVQGLNLFVREDHFVTAVERGGLGQPYEDVIPSGDAGPAWAGRSAWVAVGIAGAAVRDDLRERHHRADAVPLVEPLVVLVPGGGPVRAAAQAGQDKNGALDLAGDRFRQNDLCVQAEVERDGVATQARDEVSHPRRDAVPAAVRGALLQARLDRVEFAYSLRDRGEASSVDHVELAHQIPEGIGLGARSVQARDQHPPPDQLRQQLTRLLGTGLGELRLELVHESAPPDRRTARGKDRAHRPAQDQRRLDRASPVVLDIGLERHDEPVSPVRHGVVDDDGQPFEEVRA